MATALPSSETILRSLLGALGVAHEHYPAGRRTGSERVCDDMRRGESTRAQRRGALSALAQATRLFEGTPAELAGLERGLARWDEVRVLAELSPAVSEAGPVALLPFLQSVATWAGLLAAASAGPGSGPAEPRGPSFLARTVRRMLLEVPGRSRAARLEALNDWLAEFRPGAPGLSRSTVDRWLGRPTRPRSSALERFAAAVSGLAEDGDARVRLGRLRVSSAIDVLVGQVDSGLGLDPSTGTSHLTLLRNRFFATAKYALARGPRSAASESTNGHPNLRDSILQGNVGPIIRAFGSEGAAPLWLVGDLLGLVFGPAWWLVRAHASVDDLARMWAEPTKQVLQETLQDALPMYAVLKGEVRLLTEIAAVAPVDSVGRELLEQLVAAEELDPDQLFDKARPLLGDPQIGPLLIVALAPQLAVRSIEVFGTMSLEEALELRDQGIAEASARSKAERHAWATVSATLMLGVAVSSAKTGNEEGRLLAVSALRRLGTNHDLPGELHSRIAAVMEQIGASREARWHREAAARAGVLVA